MRKVCGAKATVNEEAVKLGVSKVADIVIAELLVISRQCELVLYKGVKASITVTL